MPAAHRQLPLGRAVSVAAVLALALTSPALAASGGALAPADGPVPQATGGSFAGAPGAPPASAAQAGAVAWGEQLPPAPSPVPSPVPIPPAATTGPTPPATIPFADLITATARRHGLAPTLLTALVWKESSFDPRAKSSAGARGLTQLMPGTAKDLGVKRVYDPAQNLDGGARYLKAQLDRFRRVDLALAAYNAGPMNVVKHKGIPPFRETRQYVRAVLAYEQQLRRR